MDRQDERRERFVIYNGAASDAGRHRSRSAELPTLRLPTPGNVEIEQCRHTRRRSGPVSAVGADLPRTRRLMEPAMRAAWTFANSVPLVDCGGPQREPLTDE
jgi:hypothetical protein